MEERGRLSPSPLKHVVALAQELARISHDEDGKTGSFAMDDRIWAVLPQELQDNILAGLPVVQIFRMRTVCKRFQSLMRLPAFLSSWTALSSPEHWLLMFHRQDSAPWISMAAYDPHVKQWYNLPVLRPFFSKQGNFSLASSQGLLCLAPVEETQTLVVWNPLTNMSRELPGMSIKNTMCVGLVVDIATKEFTIVVVGQTEDSLQTTEVYNSMVGSWKRMHTSLIEWYGCYSDPLVYCNGCFHVISAHKNGPFRLCLVSYDLKQGVWREKCKLPITAGLSFASPSLFEVKPGRLFLAERTFPGHNQPYAIHLWELKQLDNDAVEWVQVAAVPQVIIVELRREFWVSSYFKCQAIGNLVCFVGNNDFRGLVYDLSWDAWHWLPRRRERFFDHVVSFEPRLDMLSASAAV